MSCNAILESLSAKLPPLDHQKIEEGTSWPLALALSLGLV